MSKFSVSSVAWDEPENAYIGLTNEKNEVMCLIGPLATRTAADDERAKRLRLALELTEGIPTDLLEEILRRQFSVEERARLLQHLRLAWFSAVRANRVPLRHFYFNNAVNQESL